MEEINYENISASGNKELYFELKREELISNKEKLFSLNSDLCLEFILFSGIENLIDHLYTEDYWVKKKSESIFNFVKNNKQKLKTKYIEILSSVIYKIFPQKRKQYLTLLFMILVNLKNPTFAGFVDLSYTFNNKEESIKFLQHFYNISTYTSFDMYLPMILNYCGHFFKKNEIIGILTKSPKFDIEKKISLDVSLSKFYD